MRNNKGFTLTELMITVAIIGILAAIAVPMFLGQRTKAAQTEAITNLESIRLLEEQYFSENGCYRRVGGNCTNGTLTGVAAIQGLLPQFLPGTNLNFDYELRVVSQLPNGADNGVASHFIATATGRASIVLADQATGANIFFINDRNEKSW